MKESLDRRLDRLEEISGALHARRETMEVVVYGEPIPTDADIVVVVADEQVKGLVDRIGERTRERQA